MQYQILEQTAAEIRADLLQAVAAAGSGHSAGPLGMAEVLTALYCSVLQHKPKDPTWSERDRLVLSHGHICPVLYATLAHVGYLPRSELKTLRQLGSRLQGHPHRESLPGLETTSGPLGSGLSQAIGMALAARLRGAAWRTYCLLSDGEHDEGNTWEAILLAAKFRLGTLTGIVDRNFIQIDGDTEDVLPLESLGAKYRAFNWQVIEIDGHDLEAIVDACHQATLVSDQPTVILARTIPGKGVSFMENDFRWHGAVPGTLDTERTPPKALQLQVALEEISTKRHER